MLEFLPLPITWLLFFALGWLGRLQTVKFHRILIATASLMLLTAAVGWETASIYAAVGLAAILIGLWIKAARDTLLRKLVFILSVVATVAIIAAYLKWRIYFQKYFLFLPSLSYLGFRAIAWLVSAYRKRDVQLSTGLMQMFFFPMLFVGPISRVENFQKERFDYREVLRRLALAFAMLIAGKFIGCGVLSDLRYASELPAWRFWLGIPANSFEFYLTFAGYTHFVIGLGLLAGFKLPENFNNPYVATSISDFWRRWHMSLSYWVRDYIYIPLGGNRKGLLRKCLNLIIAMGIMGIWHGLTLNFLIWGLFHGSLLSIESVAAHHGWAPLQRIFGRAYVSAKVAIVFILVSFGWLLFRYPVSEFSIYMKGLVSW